MGAGSIYRSDAAHELFANLVSVETLPGCHHILDSACAAALCARIEPFLTGRAATAASTR